MSIALLLFVCVRSNFGRSSMQEEWLVRQGHASAVIVAPAGPFYNFVTGELQRYFEALSGDKLKIVSAEQARTQPKEVTFVLVGGPDVNPVVHDAVANKLISFEGLKADGFVLRTAKLSGRQLLIVGGNDESATMYAAYSLLERYGAVFLITGDILPDKASDLPLRPLDVRSEPAFSTRGMDVSSIYESRSIMSLKDQHRLLDQMAKMKFNFLMVDWMAWEPWLKYDYHGEVKHLGDVASKESGYMLWDRDWAGDMTFGSHLIPDLSVGQEHFKAAGVYPRLAAPEFQHVENSEQAFETARNYLTDIITYAKRRKIKVWVSVDATSSPPNLARYTTRTSDLPFNAIMGTFICPANPVSSEINESQLKSLVETYPAADGYFLYITEAYPVCKSTPEDREFSYKLRPQYAGEAEARAPFIYDIAQNNDDVVDSNSGSVYLIQKMMEARDRIAPGAKLGIAGIGRLYLWPFIDKLFPKDVPFADFESRAIWTPTGVPMEMFGRMASGRPNLLINRIDDDSSMLGMQFNVNLYYKDQVLEGGLKYGLRGFSTQLNRQRGTEQNTSYMAEGEWEPHLTPKQFYTRYSTRIFGARALAPMLKAFDILEENEELLGWTGQSNFPCCGVPAELRAAYQYSQQPNPFDGPKFSGWQAFLSQAHNRIYYFSESVKLLAEALQQLHAAQPIAESRSQKELTYLINRTEAYKLHLATLVRWNKAYLDLDSAFQTPPEKDRAKFQKDLDADLQEFKEVRQNARSMAEKWSELIDDPSDLGILYRINTFMVTGTELAEEFIQNVDNFHHGLDYTRQVDFGKVSISSPRLAISH